MAKSTAKRTARKPAVGLIMGSQSDWATMRHAAETLEALGVPFEARIISAHRTPKPPTHPRCDDGPRTTHPRRAPQP